MRFEVLRRDGFRCRYCGATAVEAELTVDHVTPSALGGPDEPSNLVTACEPCNSGKTSSTPDATLVADVAEDAVRWAAAMKQAARNLKEQERPALEYRVTFLAAWDHWTSVLMHRARALLPDDWKKSVENFRLAGLPADVWPEIIETAMANRKVVNANVYRYCCGIAWKRVGLIQEEARRLLGEPQTAVASESRDPAFAVQLWTSSMRIFWGTATTQEEEETIRSQAEVILSLEGENEASASISAVLAGYFCSYILHRGIAAKNAADLRVDRVEKALELWTRSYYDSTGCFPTAVVTRDFVEFVDQALADVRYLKSFTYPDVLAAAVLAGSYQDPNLWTCLLSRNSAIEAASQLLPAA
jgi:hypothetical protein